MANSGWQGLREGVNEALEGLAMKALEPVLRRWLKTFSRDQLRLQGLKCELYDLDLQASVRGAHELAPQRAARAQPRLTSRPGACRSCTPRSACLSASSCDTRAWTACECRRVTRRCVSRRARQRQRSA